MSEGLPACNRHDRVALTGFAPVRAPTPPDVRFSASGGWIAGVFYHTRSLGVMNPYLLSTRLLRAS